MLYRNSLTHVMMVMIGMLLMQGMICAMSMLLFATRVMMTMMVMTMLGMCMLMAVMPLAMMDVMWCRGICGNWWMCGLIALHRWMSFLYENNKTAK